MQIEPPQPSQYQTRNAGQKTLIEHIKKSQNHVNFKTNTGKSRVAFAVFIFDSMHHKTQNQLN